MPGWRQVAVQTAVHLYAPPSTALRFCFVYLPIFSGWFLIYKCYDIFKCPAKEIPFLFAYPGLYNILYDIEWKITQRLPTFMHVKYIIICSFLAISRLFEKFFAQKILEVY